jgi:transglutaminase-like putative cysteine protease
VGYGYTTNPTLRPLSLVVDVLHAWPEYFDSDKKLWVPVDPTWGRTTRGTNYFDQPDFNHIVFAIHSTSNEEPLPPGFYRRPGQAGKDVVVDFVNEIKTKNSSKIVTGIDIFPVRISTFCTCAHTKQWRN